MSQGSFEVPGSGGDSKVSVKLPSDLRPASGSSVGDAGEASLPDFDPTCDTLLEP